MPNVRVPVAAPNTHASRGELILSLEEELEGLEDELTVVSMAITVDEPWVCSAVSVVCNRIKGRVGAVRRQLQGLHR